MLSELIFYFRRSANGFNGNFHIRIIIYTQYILSSIYDLTKSKKYFQLYKIYGTGRVYFLSKIVIQFSSEIKKG